MKVGTLAISVAVYFTKARNFKQKVKMLTSV